jgi:hypothetical protein
MKSSLSGFCLIEKTFKLVRLTVKTITWVSLSTEEKKNRKRENGKGVTYRIVVRGGWVGGEEDGKRGDEEEGEHGGDEDPVREEAP